MTLFCGIDWAEGHHDLAVVDSAGKLTAKKRINEDVAGFAELTDLLAELGDTAEDPIPVAIETRRGLLVAALRATGRPVFAINPMADAMTLANILRVDAHTHRRVPADSDLAQAVAVLARAQQDAIWRRTKASNELRAVLREYYPTFLEAFAGKSATNLANTEARAILAIAPTPALGAALSKSRIAAALRRAGRTRYVDRTAADIKAALREPQLRQPRLVEDAFGRQGIALLATLDAACTGADDLGAAAADAFHQPPDYAIITSFPGLADSTCARMLAEIGDDRTRFADARAAQGLRRIRTRHPRIRAVDLRHLPAGQERPSRCCRLALGVHRRHPLRTCQSPLSTPS